MKKPWLDLAAQIKCGLACSFLTHGNIWDDVFLDENFLRPDEAINKLEPLCHSGITAYFNFRTGVRFAEEAMRNAFLQLAVKPVLLRMGRQDDSPLEHFESFKDSLRHALSWFNEILVLSWKEVLDRQKNDKGLVEILSFIKERCPEKKRDASPFAVCVFEYEESKLPPEAPSSSSSFDRICYDFFRSWAQDPVILRNRNVIIHMAETLADVPLQLREDKSFIKIEVPLPDREAFEEILPALGKLGHLPAVKDSEGRGLSILEIAKIASGLSIIELKQIFRRALVSRGKLTGSALFEHKAKLIQDKLGEMITIEKPPWGWESIGGLDHHIGLFAVWADALRRGDISRLPKGGVLAVGAPGTGKTVSAEAAAHEADVPFVKLRSTLDPYVGMSERRTYLARDVIYAMRPVVLFIDEFDKMFFSQDRVFHGDSGVGLRTMGIWMDFFSDPKIHGQVLTIAACNRPDRIETAMKRAGRFDTILPYLIPEKEDRPHIFKALFEKERIRFSLSGLNLDVSEVLDDAFLIKISAMLDFWWDEKESFPSLRLGPPPEGVEELSIRRKITVIRVTGAEMEEVIGLALRPFLDEKDSAALRGFSQEERSKFLAVKFPPRKIVRLERQALIDAIENSLPHEDAEAYEAMNLLALLSVKDLRLVPPEHREKARQLRVDKSLRAQIQRGLLSSFD